MRREPRGARRLLILTWYSFSRRVGRLYSTIEFEASRSRSLECRGPEASGSGADRMAPEAALSEGVRVQRYLRCLGGKCGGGKFWMIFLGFWGVVMIFWGCGVVVVVCGWVVGGIGLKKIVNFGSFLVGAWVGAARP